jgi:hypothetical protein
MKAGFVFIFYFLFCLMFYFIIQASIFKISSLFNYFSYNYTLSNNIVLSLGLIQLMSLTNQTDQMLYNYFLQEKGVNNDISNLSKSTSTNHSHIRTLIDNTIKVLYYIENFYFSDSMYKNLGQIIDINCETMFPKFKDPFIENVITKYPEYDYYKLLSKYCSTLPVLKNATSELILYTIINREIGKILNMFDGTDWDTYVYINNQHMLYELYSDVICIMRPLRKQMNNYLSQHIIKVLLLKYQLSYAAFLVSNVLYEFIILLFIKCFIINKIVSSMKNIIILGKAFDCY